MQYFVIAICAILIALAIIIFIRTLIKMFKGKCCEGCKGCPVQQDCSIKQEEEQKKQENIHEKDHS